MTDAEPFLEYRPLLFSIAYRMLGSAADAEDAVQETYLRWHRARNSDDVIRNPKGWLTTTLSRICLDQLGSARAKREQYVGPWLPEPLAGSTPDVAETSADFDSISLAFMVLLESLSPKERAVFLLHDVFGYDFSSVGEIVGESESYSRQLAKRARAHMTERRPRFSASEEQQRQLTAKFLQAITTGDMPGLISTLTEDVTIYADGGGKVTAARKPVVGRDTVVTFMTRIFSAAPPGMEFHATSINGAPGIIGLFDGALFDVITFDIDDEGIRAIYTILNPDKLHAVAEALALPIATDVSARVAAALKQEHQS